MNLPEILLKHRESNTAKVTTCAFPKDMKSRVIRLRRCGVWDYE